MVWNESDSFCVGSHEVSQRWCVTGVVLQKTTGQKSPVSIDFVAQRGYGSEVAFSRAMLLKHGPLEVDGDESIRLQRTNLGPLVMYREILPEEIDLASEAVFQDAQRGVYIASFMDCSPSAQRRYCCFE